MLPRVMLVLNGVAFFGFGIVSLLSPETLAEPVGYILSTLTAFTEFRAFYGGFEIGTAAFLLVCAARPRWWRMGLVASALMIGGTALGRLYGLATDGEAVPIMLIVLTAEVVATVLSLVALRSVPAETAPIVSIPDTTG